MYCLFSHTFRVIVETVHFFVEPVRFFVEPVRFFVEPVHFFVEPKNRPPGFPIIVKNRLQGFR